MTTRIAMDAWQHRTYQVVGFDRLRFASDVAEAIPESATCRLEGLNLAVDGVRVSGWLAVCTPDAQQLQHIGQRLRSVRGMVSVTEQP